MASLPRSSPADEPTAPPSRSPWVILGSIPHVLQGGGGGGGGGGEAEAADLSLALTAPPRVSHLFVSQRVFPIPDRPTAKNFPFVLSADPSGLLLLSANLYAALTCFDDIDRPGNQSFIFVLDATTGSAFRLPDPRPKETIQNQALVGLIACPGGGGRYMVAELLLPMLLFSEKAILRRYSSDLGEWVIKSVHYRLPQRTLVPICTLAHHGRLWWVDYSCGIITTDPFADDPVLRFVPLPRSCLLGYWEAVADFGVLDMFRYFGVSAGKLRFVNTYRRGGAPNKVTVWTLPDADATEWTLEHEATFADLWADYNYKATGLPMQVPVLALIHPYNPAVVYFLLNDHLFGVDVRARMVVECDCYHPVAPPRNNYPVANRFIRAWELPRAWGLHRAGELVE